MIEKIYDEKNEELGLVIWYNDGIKVNNLAK